jgi:ferritin|tara:strand:+ start:185 stop:760 length:576 start_codon:yes stop_codon:yes gene_type:complete
METAILATMTYQRRNLLMMDAKIQQAVSSQINLEFAASYSYLAMGIYMEARHLSGFASWMVQQSNEEQSHAQRLLRYMLYRDAYVTLETIPKPRVDYEGIHEVFSVSLEQEKSNTASINELYALARDLKDYATQAHLQWFLDEQVEEEKTICDILGRLELAGDDRTALLLLDEHMGKRSSEGIDAVSFTDK